MTSLQTTASLPIANPNEHVYGLDVFRSFAILFVLIGHSLEHSKIAEPIKTLGHMGILGVELFFVLSGFLIGSILLRLIDKGQLHSWKHIAHFWQRRWLRTLPMYFVVLIVFLRLDYHGRHGLWDYPTYYVFLQNFATAIPEFFELSWSLAIEEHFYLWFPLVFLVWQRLCKRASYALVLTAMTFVVVAYTFRLSHPLQSDWNVFNRLLRMSVLARLDAIMYGVLIAAAKRYAPRLFITIRQLTPLSASAFVLLCAWWFINAPHLTQTRWMQLHLFTVQAILCALLLPWFDNWKKTDAKQDFFTITSKLSYSLYLNHILVIIVINKMLSHLNFFDAAYNNPFIVYPLYFTFFYSASWVTYHRIEKPFLDLREQPKNATNFLRAGAVSIAICLAFILFF